MVLAYLEGRNQNTANRIVDFDFAASEHRKDFATGLSPSRITQGTITSANKLKARLANNSWSSWFAPQEAKCPWHLITSAHTFVNADPSICGGIYDDLCQLYFHFDSKYMTGRPNRVGETQVNKVLHQVFPGLVPIFDKKLRDLYASSVPGIRTQILAVRNRTNPTNKWNRVDSFVWESLRRDIAAIPAADFKAIRDQVRNRPSAGLLMIGGGTAQKWAADNLTDLRLIDMIAWQL